MKLAMSRGGARKGAGKKTSWRSGCNFEQTKLIRVPIAISNQLLEIAHWLDEGGDIEKVAKSIQHELPLSSKSILEIETNSKAYTETDLAKEIEVNRSTLKSKKRKCLDGVISEDDFCAYLRDKDPLSRNWRYSLQDKTYYLNQ